MSDLTPEAVKAALEAATPGPWKANCPDDLFPGVSIGDCEPKYGRGQIVVNDCSPPGDLDLHRSNARLIAMAPTLATAYLELAEENERLRKRVEAADAMYRATEFLADNDPDEIVCDGGGTAILVGLSGIRAALAAYRATEDGK